jgi:iron-regulated transporter 1
MAVVTAQQMSVVRRLYTSHFLSAWNSRTFEFGAVLFLSAIFPGTLLYASIYALLRALAATLFSSRVGSYVDRANRLVSIRQSIIWQRISVALSCILLLVLFSAPRSVFVFWFCFPAAIILACFEKLASIGNTVAIERDWVIVICDNTKLSRHDLNATLRRIDLFCKLAAPVFISFTDAYSTGIAIVIVFGMSTISIFVEYVAIAQVYQAVPDLGKKIPLSNQPDNAALEMSMDASAVHQDDKISPQTFSKSIISVLQPWIEYCTSPVFLASLALSMLYLTVLSTGVQYQTYMLATGYSAITVSLLRVAAVISELAATCFAPLLTDRIGPIRSGLWSINWQVMWLAGAVVSFICLEDKPKIAGAGLTAGIVASRLGLWGFDLSVQFIIQEVYS